MKETRLNVRFTKTLYGTADGNFSVVAAMPHGESIWDIRVNDRGSIVITGDFYIPRGDMGKVFDVTIKEDTKSKYENSWKLVRINYGIPTEAKEQWEYLLNTKLVTQKQYASLRATYSPDVKIVDMFLDTPELIKAKHFGHKTIQNVKERIGGVVELGMFAEAFGDVEGVSDGMIKKLVNATGDFGQLLEIIKKNPFHLLQFKGFGFMTADAIRASLKIPLEDRNRCIHGLKFYTTNRFDSNGNTYANIPNAIKEAASELKVPNSLISGFIDSDDIGEYGLVTFGNCITTKELLVAEQHIYKYMLENIPYEDNFVNSHKWIEEVDKAVKASPFEVNQKQLDFLYQVNESRVTALVGQGGTGKSWLTKSLCDILDASGRSYTLMSPTAKAAYVLREYTGRYASTIHREIYGYDAFTETRTIKDSETDVLIIDEFSMCDSVLFSDILTYAGDSTRIVIIGDSLQIPSISPGNVLHDLTNHLSVPTIALDTVYRFGDESGIEIVTSEIREKKLKLDKIQNKVEYKDDLTFFNFDNDSEILDAALAEYKRLYDSGVTHENIMLLTPKNIGTVGKNALNKEIQKIVNGDNNIPSVIFGKNSTNEDDRTYFRIGDYVTIKKNSYSFEDTGGRPRTILNGDFGYIEGVDIYGETITLSVDGVQFEFLKEEIQEYVEHGWASTIHKAQGSESEFVIAILSKSSAFQLNGNLIYTGLSRTKKNAKAYGDFNTINRVSKTFVNTSRRTLIKYTVDHGGGVR